MTEPSGSSQRDAFAVLVAARPHTPADLTSPDTPHAEDLFRRIVAVDHARGLRSTRRRQLSLAVGAAAAAAVVGILLTVPGRKGPSSVGSAETTAPSSADAATPATVTATEWPSIAPSPPVGALNTARAMMVYDDQWNSGRTDYVLADGDVSILIYGSPAPANGMPPVTGLNGPIQSGPSTVVAENRYANGEWYYHLEDENGDMQWSYDPNDDPIGVEVSPADPRELYDRLAPTAGFEPDGTDLVRGLETVHLIATTPDGVDPSLVPFVADEAHEITGLELWVDSNGVVTRVAVDYTVSTPVAIDENGDTVPVDDPTETATVSIEFFDIGEPITVDVPRDAVEIDAQG